jgi:cob(I)alamin adenosyltransferase
LVNIYTRTGDDGSTGLRGNQRVSKSDPRIEAVGDMDAANAALGFAAVNLEDAELKKHIIAFQGHFLSAGAVVAGYEQPVSHTELAEQMEPVIDQFEKELEPLTQFILPGGTESSARIHLARSAVRRAERAVIRLESPPASVVIYLNRLSDLLFVMARVANRRSNVDDVIWDSGA